MKLRLLRLVYMRIGIFHTGPIFYIITKYILFLLYFVITKNDAEFAAMTASDLAKRLRSNISADEAFQVVSYIHKFARYQAARCGLVNCSEVC